MFSAHFSFSDSFQQIARETCGQESGGCISNGCTDSGVGRQIVLPIIFLTIFGLLSLWRLEVLKTVKQGAVLALL
jgi:hypothetical protein